MNGSEIYVQSLKEIIEHVLKIETKNKLFFRGQRKDYCSLFPSVYRFNNYKYEDEFYREMQVYNKDEFISDLSAFEKLCRMQHYEAPTRLLDISSDIMSAVYMAVNSKTTSYKDDAIIYIFEINEKDIKYYDSDAVSVVSNLAKLKYKDSKKSKKNLVKVLKKEMNGKLFNKSKSVKYLLHEIREEKNYFLPIIEQKDLHSIFCVKAKYNNSRIKAQKGLFLLFGLNKENYKKPLELIDKNNNLTQCENHPIKVLHKIYIKKGHVNKIRDELNVLGISTPYLLPEMDKVSEYLKEKFGDRK